MSPEHTPEPLAFSVSELPAVISVGRTTVTKLIKSGDLPSRSLGARVIVLREDLQAFLRSLPVRGVAA